LPATEKGFGTVAAGFSDDQISRYRGGEAGWFTSDELFDRWPKSVITAGLALKEVGSISAVLATAEGFYLVKKMDERVAVVSPLAQVSGGIHRQLLTAKLDAVEKNFQASLRTAANVQTDLILLGTIAYPTQTVANAMSMTPPALLHTP
jgi:parvulin-like peptidyl-prolyl isomerase